MFTKFNMEVFALKDLFSQTKRFLEERSDIAYTNEELAESEENLLEAVEVLEDIIEAASAELETLRKRMD